MKTKQLEWEQNGSGDWEAFGFFGCFQVVESESGEGFTASLNDSNDYDGFDSQDFASVDEAKAYCQSLLEKQVEGALKFLDWSGKKSLKEWANWLGMGVVVDYNGRGLASLQRLVIGDRVIPFNQPVKAWRLAERGDIMFIPQEFIDFNGDWTTSLILPDGWETKGENK